MRSLVEDPKVNIKSFAMSVHGYQIRGSLTTSAPDVRGELRERYLLRGERSPQETSTYRDHSPQSVEENTPAKYYRRFDLNLVRADPTTPEKRNPYPVGVICPPHSTHSIASLGHSPHALAKQLGKGQGTGPA